MSRIGYGYGSEWHLLRYLGRHRERFNQAVLAEVVGDAVKWLDSPFQGTVPFDAELKGVDFLRPDDPARSAWLRYWPQTGNVPNWDAVGAVTLGGAREWLLVEAKAHLGELTSSCDAKSHGGLPRITAVLETVKSALGVDTTQDWLHGYYQYCNRIAALQFLERQGVPARLLFIYFTGEQHAGWSCPVDAQGWSGALGLMEKHVGLPAEHALSRRIHRLFLPIRGDT